MAEEKHRMLYQGQDPSVPVLRHPALLPRACSERSLPATQSPSSQLPPTYDDAMAKASLRLTPHSDMSCALAQPHDTRRCTFFAEPQHLRSRLELPPPQLCSRQRLACRKCAVSRQPQLQLKISMNSFCFSRGFFALAPQPKLSAKSCAIVCPACGQQGRTRLQRMPNARTHTWALWLCSFGWCCCCCLYPYVMRGCRTTSHYCNACRTFLGAYYPRDCCL
ncbi:hypothetical protein KR093_000970 [Drosophila rubida]|uniref:LITAF domain-containing protein n=1 Tax=Drosophila rubida TaxID=30044 RepID=A0AAD4KAR7_9MUSC|nr:hypothetical protein KR093_000970 [Drosophila rubida]